MELRLGFERGIVAKSVIWASYIVFPFSVYSVIRLKTSIPLETYYTSFVLRSRDQAKQERYHRLILQDD